MTKTNKKNFYSPSMLKKYLSCKHIIFNEKYEKELKLKKRENTILDQIRFDKGNLHEKNINLSIDKNIIGTCNIVKACKKQKTKLIYLSTNYVYPGTLGNYKETDPLLPYNNYAWSKLGGECAVQMYKNSLILRICMTEKPFIHKYAFKDLITNFIFHDEVVKIFPKLLKEKGIINLGGKTASVYSFAKKHNTKVKSIKAKKFLGNTIPLKHSMNIKKLNKIIND